MNKKIILPLLLILSIPLGESYNLFHVPYLNLKSFFLLDRSLKQDLEWYVKDTSEGLTWIIFLFVWYRRERIRKNKFWSWLILLFLLFRIVDLLVYWLNHRHAGIIYGACYLTIIIYAGINTLKEYKKNRKK